MKSNPNQAAFVGDILELPDWSFTAPYRRVPHRSRVYACHESGKQTYYVQGNHPETLFWVHCVGLGFAGDKCRNSQTCTTKHRKVADLWIEAVKAGKVRVKDRTPL